MRPIGMSGGIERVGDGLRKRPDRVAVVVAVAVLAGIYLGSTTVAEIDPFYRQGAAQAGSSYTSDGWRGADAVPPPADQPPSESRASRFMSGVYAWAPAPVREFAADVAAARDVAAEVAAVGSEIGDYARSLDSSSETLVPEAPPSDPHQSTSHAAVPPVEHADDCDPAYESCPPEAPSGGDDDRPYFEDSYPPQ